MFNKIKIPIFATLIIVGLLFFQGVHIISLSKKEMDQRDILELIQKSSEVTKNLKSLNFKSNLIYQYAILDKNLNSLYSNLKDFPPTLDFQILKFKNNIYYKNYFFYNDNLYYIITSKQISYEKITLITFFLLAMTIIVIGTIMYFSYRGIVKPHLEQRVMMNAFFNDAMHELKTPLGVATINLEMLNVKNKQTHRIKAALKQMKVTYEDVEFFIKNDKISFVKKVISLSNFIHSRIRFASTIAHNKEMKIISEIEPNLEIFMSEVEITRVIDNTIANAIKYSKEKTNIIVRLKKEQNYAVFEVEDFGIGIKDTATIWDRYAREDKSQGGFGLGLNIILNICLKNDILYSVKSVHGKGSTFTYKIPLYKEKILDNIS